MTPVCDGSMRHDRDRLGRDPPAAHDTVPPTRRPASQDLDVARRGVAACPVAASGWTTAQGSISLRSRSATCTAVLPGVAVAPIGLTPTVVCALAVTGET